MVGLPRTRGDRPRARGLSGSSAPVARTRGDRPYPLSIRSGVDPVAPHTRGSAH